MKDISLNRSLIKITGDDKKSFLQKLVTSDINQLQQFCLAPSSLLSPQGKILFSFLLSLVDNDIYIDAETNYIDFLANRLNLYKLNADVSLTIYKNIKTIIHNKAAKFSFLDTRFSKSIYRNYSHFAPLPPIYEFNFRLFCIENGIAQIGYDFEPNSYFPHDLNYDLINAVSFTKGCFIGQEVVARMQHRAHIKKRTMIIKSKHAIQKGNIIYANGKEAGIIGNTINNQALAIIRIDYTAGAVATCNEKAIKIIAPPYLELT